MAEEMVVVDPYFSPYAGAPDLLTAHKGLELVSDHFQKDRKDTTMRVFSRAIEQILVWEPVNLTSSVIQHEVFGHGYRLRELGVKPNGYLIAPGWGWTSFEFDEDEFLLGEMLAVSVAGLEAEGILAQRMKMRFIGDGCIDGRLATLYTQAEQSLFWYTVITQLGRLRGETPDEGNDIDGYLELHNAAYPSQDLSIGELTTWAAFNWLDPMTFYAFFSWFYYIAEGCPLKFPMIPLSDSVRYLPNVRIGYAPYAPEAYLENYFQIDCKPLYFYLKGGPSSMGLGFSYDHLFCGDWGRIGLHFDAWRHETFMTAATMGDFLEWRNTAFPKEYVVGGALTLTAKFQLFKCVSLFLEGGGKTKGYLPGTQLDSGGIARIGIVIGGDS